MYLSLIPAPVLVFVLLLSAAGCKEKTPVIQIESAEATISPMLVGVASIFMKIVNSGGADDTLVAARTEVQGTITELHDIRDGKMVKVESIAIPPDSTVLLRPARHHIMILKLPADMKEGSQFSLVLTFKRSGEKRLPLQLQPFARSRGKLQK